MINTSLLVFVAALTGMSTVWTQPVPRRSGHSQSPGGLDTASPQAVWTQPVPRPRCDFQADFINPNRPVSPSGRGVSWRVPFRASSPCSGQGVLQLTPPLGTSTLTVDMQLRNPTAWTFHVGDSPSNDGKAGDYGHTNNAAEIHNTGPTTHLYRAFTGLNRSTLRSSLMYNSVRTGRYTITIKKPVGTRDQVTVNNYHGVNIDFYDPLLFVWDTMYMGINRVVNGPYRSGTGLCSVCITWS